MTIQEADKIIEELNQMHKMVCTCNRLGICQRCTMEVSLPPQVVEEAEKIIENHYNEVK